MADKSVLARIREFLDSLGGDDTSEDGSDIRADDAPTDDAENIPDDDTGDGSDEGGDDSGASNEDGNDADEDGGDSDDEETMPDSEAELAQLRDSITVIATENERLRTLLTDNGIDFEGEPEIEAAIDKADSEDESEAEYDDEAAQADIDAVKARNAEWDK